MNPFLMHNSITAHWFGYRQNYNKIKHLHKKCLQFINNDKLSSYEELLEKDASDSVHHRNTQSLAIEIFQMKHGQSPETVTDIFT